jgi:hypothetical protein
VPGSEAAVIERLLAWWSPPAPAARPAVLRVLVGGFAFCYALLRAPNLLSATQFHAGEFHPVGIARLLSEPLPSSLVYLSVGALLVSGALFVLGWRFKLVGPLFAALLLWAMTYRSSFGMIFHTDNMLTLHVALLALSPAADALSLDARRTGKSAPPAASAEYGWVIRAMAVVTACTYVVAAIAKLKLAGAGWFGGELLRAQIAFDNLRKIELGSSFSPLGVWMVKHRSVFAPLAVATLFVELGAPLALAHRRVALLWSLSAWAFHLGVGLMMNIGFPYQLAFVAFAPLYRVERLLELAPLRRWATQLGAVNKPSTPV